MNNTYITFYDMTDESLLEFISQCIGFFHYPSVQIITIAGTDSYEIVEDKLDKNQ